MSMQQIHVPAIEDAVDTGLRLGYLILSGRQPKSLCLGTCMQDVDIRMRSAYC